MSDPHATRARILEPPPHIVEFAVSLSKYSPCRSKRGVVVFDGGDIIAHGYNSKPRGFECDGSETCKATCRREAVHAEQAALMMAGSRAFGREMIHVKSVDGTLVPSGGPSCVECSKLARAAGIAWFWLYHEDGWRRYDMAEFHRLSLVAVRAAAQEPNENWPKRLRVLVRRIDKWEDIDDGTASDTIAEELLLDVKQCLESILAAVPAPAPAPSPEKHE